MKHQHKHGHYCYHRHIKFCKVCQRPYCEDCGMEWYESQAYIYSYPYYTYTIQYDDNQWQLTTGGTACSHEE